MGHLTALRLFARQELLVALRSRRTPIFALVFTVLSLVVASSGYVLSGGSGVQDFVRAGTLLGIEGTAASGAASLALLRFTRGPWGCGGSHRGFPPAVDDPPVWMAMCRLDRSDLWDGPR